MKLKAEFIFPKELKDEAIICYLCKNFDIILNILEASFSTSVGWAILILEGNDSNLKKCLRYLIDRGIEIKNTQEMT